MTTALHVPAATLDDEIFEMVNLPRKDTGVDGIVYVSTAQGPHGPRVKWYPDRPGRDAPCLTVCSSRSHGFRDFP